MENFYVNGSGDIRAHSSSNAPRKWRFGVQNPLNPSSDYKIGIVQLKTGSVSSSGGYVEKNKINNTNFDHHIINPKNGFSSQKTIASTVYATSALLSDVFATTLMCMNPQAGIKLLNKQKLAGVVVSDLGNCLLSNLAIKNFGL